MIFVGHSHMICVLNAATEAGLPFRAVTLKPVKNKDHLFGLDASRLIEDPAKPEFRADTKAVFAGADGLIFSFISGIAHVELGLRSPYYPEAPIDFVLPESPERPLLPEAQLIPYDMVRLVIARSFKRRLKALREVAAAAPGRVVQFVPPPPAPDRFLRHLLERHLDTAEPALPPRSVRWKLWRATADVFREHAEKAGARFVDAPPESMDAEGFMRDEFVRNLTHGNVAFGRLLLEQIQSLS